MDKLSFRIWAPIAFGGLIAFIVMFPFLLAALVSISSCQGSGGACGAVGALVGMTVKPLGVLLIAGAIGWLVYKRIRWLEFSFWWTLATVCWLIGSFAFLIAIGNFWGANFGMGLIHIKAPILLLFLIIFMVFLAVKDTYISSEDSNYQSVAWLVAGGAAGHSVLLSLGQILMGLIAIPYFGSLVSGLGFYNLVMLMGFVPTILGLGLPLQLVLWIDLTIFTLALTYILLPNWFGGGPARSAPSAPPTNTVAPSASTIPRLGSKRSPGFGRRTSRI